LSSYKVTFISDYFVLYTTVDTGIYDDEEICDQANQLVKDWCGFEPQKFATDYDIEEVSYANV
jgi:hypothetical protein